MSNHSFKQWQDVSRCEKCHFTEGRSHSHCVFALQHLRGGGSKSTASLLSFFNKLSQLNLFSLLAAKLHLSSAAYTQFVYKYMWGVMPGLCLAGESPEIQGFSLLQKTLSGILGQKVVQQPEQTTTSLEKPATKRERERERV